MPQPQPVSEPSRPARLSAPAWWRRRTPAQRFCLIVGVLLGVRGLQQFIAGPSFATPGDGWRAGQQVLTAAILLLAQREHTVALRALVPFAAFYSVVSIVGDINGHEAFGLLPVDGRDLYAHPLYAVTALLILGLAGRRRIRTT